MVWRVSLVVIAAVLIAAHFLREGNLAVVALCLLSPLLLFVRRRWSLIVLQILAYVAALIWLNTMVQIVLERMSIGRSWSGVVAILGTVSLVTLLAGLVLNSAVIKRWYSAPPAETEATEPAE